MGHDRSKRVLQRRVTESGLAEGAVAQLGERLPCTQEVSGSIPLSSTKSLEDRWLLTKVSVQKRMFHNDEAFLSDHWVRFAL